jgi:hypothetical protein
MVPYCYSTVTSQRICCDLFFSDITRTIKAKNLGNVSFVPLIDYEDQIAGDTDHIGIRSRIMTGTDNSQYIVKPHIVHGMSLL